MLTGSEIAKSGIQTEKQLANKLNQDPLLIKQLASLVSSDLPFEKPWAEHVGGSSEKADILIFSSNQFFGITVKKSGSSDFNQALRGDYKRFSANLDIDKQVCTGAFANALAQRKQNQNRLFCAKRDTDLINVCEAQKFSIVEKALFGKKEENVEILTVFDTLKKAFFFVDKNTVLAYICQNHFWVNKGGNLMLGNDFGIYRKGGDGHKKTYAKDHVNHPGNNLVVKIKPRSLIRGLLEVYPQKIIELKVV